MLDSWAIARISKLSPFGKSAAYNLLLVANSAATRFGKVKNKRILADYQICIIFVNLKVLRI